MPFENEHAARLKRPGDFVSFRRKNDEGGTGIDFIFGIKEDKTSEIQSIRFDAKKFTVKEAKDWLKEHDFKPILFEPAIEKEKGYIVLNNTLTRQKLLKALKSR